MPHACANSKRGIQYPVSPFDSLIVAMRGSVWPTDSSRVVSTAEAEHN